MFLFFQISASTSESTFPPFLLPFSKVLVSVGRRPVTRGLGLEELGVKVGKGGFVEVDEGFRTQGM